MCFLVPRCVYSLLLHESLSADGTADQLEVYNIECVDIHVSTLIIILSYTNSCWRATSDCAKCQACL